MDWKYKHFNQQAIFSAPIQSVLEAARAATPKSLVPVEDTPDGFVARGHDFWHAREANVHVTSAVEGTQVRIELAVERLGMRGYMLVDIAGYYNAEIDKWFEGITQRLGSSAEGTLVRKTTVSYRVQRGCLAGCAVWLVVGACLGVLGTALDRQVFPGTPDSAPGPFSLAAATIALLVGVGAFLYVRYPQGPLSKLFRRSREGTSGGQDL